jgi:DNA-binding GntR family transcriptional regulator
MADRTEQVENLAAELGNYMSDSLNLKGRTKRTAARLAISSAIRDGLFQPGDMLPPETELSAMLGVGLGTVQVALRQLQEVGSISRRRGDGTRVASAEPLDPSVWHFRFIRIEDGMPLHPVADWVNVDLVPRNQLLEDKLGSHVGYQRIRRRYSAKGCDPFATEMYLNPALNIDLSAVPPDELRMVNIRTYLEDEFNIVAAGSDQTVKLSVLHSDIAEAFQLEAGQQVYEIDALTSARDSRPIYFQRIYVPAMHYSLNFINSSH